MQPLRILVPFALSTLTIAQTGTFVSAGTGCPAPAPPGLGMTTAPSVGVASSRLHQTNLAAQARARATIGRKWRSSKA